MRRSTVFLSAGVAAAALGAALYLLDPSTSTPVAPLPVVAAVLPAEPAPAPAPVPATAAVGFGLDTIEVIVSRNDTLDRIFRKLQLNVTDLASIRQLPGIRQTLDFLKPGDAITFLHREGELRGLTRKINDTQTLNVTRDDAGFAAQIVENPLESQVQRKQIRITSSLFEAASAGGVSDQTALALSEIFGWDVDFVLDIREGDEFTVVYEGLWQDDKYLRDGNILAAEFVNDGRTFRAVRYERADGSAEYFTPDGKSMRKAFLRAPLEFSRISSGFNPRRRHPVLNTIRAHKGVDYAAPTGTPVRAAGDGRVIFAGHKGGYGRVVEVAHSNGVVTRYGHLSRFSKGTHVGRRVDQGTVIAYVGMSGLATGPHLHYEYQVNGVHKNPQTVKLGDAKPISPELLADFRAKTAPLLAKLDPVHNGQMLARQ